MSGGGFSVYWALSDWRFQEQVLNIEIIDDYKKPFVDMHSHELHPVLVLYLRPFFCDCYNELEEEIKFEAHPGIFLAWRSKSLDQIICLLHPLLSWFYLVILSEEFTLFKP